MDGIAQGLQQGLEEGELKAKIAIAKKLLATGLGLETIAEIADLTPDEIKKLAT
jgi:predicted transposase/invertase (TIGR01784 family)